MDVVIRVITCVDFIVRPSNKPVAYLKSKALIINLDPSINIILFGPIIILTTAFRTNIIPKLTTMNVTGLLFLFL